MNFNNKSENQKGSGSNNEKPFLVNRDEGVAAWVNTDKNGNAYLSVKLPLGLGYVNLFANTLQDDERKRDVMNKLRGALDEL